MRIDIEQLKTDAAYWEFQAPKGSTHFKDGIYAWFMLCDGEVFVRDEVCDVWFESTMDCHDLTSANGFTERPTFTAEQPQHHDPVNSPSHYASGGIECIDAMQAMLTRDEFIGYLRGNIFKYQWRYKLKNGVEDLEKAQWYASRLIKMEQGE